MELVTPGIGLIFWMTLSFLIVLFLLKKFAWRPILGALNEREKSIEKALNSAEEAKAEVAKIKDDNLKIIEQAKIERDGIIKDAKEVKEQIIKEARAEAKQKAEAMIADALSEIQNQKDLLLNEMKVQIAEFSVDIAEKIIKTELSDTSKKEEVINKFISDLKLN